MSDELGKQFWRNIAAMTEETAQSLSPVRVTIVSEDAGEVTLIRADDPDQTPDETTHPRLAGIQLIPGDDAYALPLGNSQLLVVGRLQNASLVDQLVYDKPVAFTTDVSMSGPGLQTDGLLSHSTVFDGNVAAETNMDVKNLMTSLFTTNSQASADTANTTNTVTMQDAISASVTLPPGLLNTGTYKISVVGGVNLINSAGATARVCATINGVQGNIHVTAPLDTTRYTYCVAAHEANVVGGAVITCKIQYRCGSANTTTATNPAITVIAKRIS